MMEPSAMAGSMDDTFSWWDRIRASLLLAVIVVVGLSALPLPPPITQRDLDNPVIAADVDVWVELLQGAGLSLTREQLVSRVELLTVTPRNARRVLLTPFRPLFKATATGQGWGLFSVPDTRPNGLVVEGRTSEDAAWLPLYDARDPAHQWLSEAFHYRRVIGVYGAINRRPRFWTPFVRWVAAQALADHPELSAVRVLLVRASVSLPGKPAPSDRKERFVIEVPREEAAP